MTEPRDSGKPAAPPENPSYVFEGWHPTFPSPWTIVCYATALGVVCLWVIAVAACVLALIWAF